MLGGPRRRFFGASLAVVLAVVGLLPVTADPAVAVDPPVHYEGTLDVQVTHSATSANSIYSFNGSYSLGLSATTADNAFQFTTTVLEAQASWTESAFGPFCTSLDEFSGSTVVAPIATASLQLSPPTSTYSLLTSGVNVSGMRNKEATNEPLCGVDIDGEVISQPILGTAAFAQDFPLDGETFSGQSVETSTGGGSSLVIRMTWNIVRDVLPDRDGDGITDSADNCPDNANTDQANNEGDAQGDVCDDDDDNDLLPDLQEPGFGTSPTNPDFDGDGVLDGQEVVDGSSPLAPDSDGDGVGDAPDQCEGTPPGVQVDAQGCNEENHPPIARPDTKETSYDTLDPANRLLVIPLLGNDEDPDGDPLTVTTIEQDLAHSTPGLGVILLDPTVGDVKISSSTPRLDDDHDIFGVMRFTYSISDGRGGTDSASVEAHIWECHALPELTITYTEKLKKKLIPVAGRGSQTVQVVDFCYDTENTTSDQDHDEDMSLSRQLWNAAAIFWPIPIDFDIETVTTSENVNSRIRTCFEVPYIDNVKHLKKFAKAIGKSVNKTVKLGVIGEATGKIYEVGIPEAAGDVLNPGYCHTEIKTDIDAFPSSSNGDFVIDVEVEASAGYRAEVSLGSLSEFVALLESPPETQFVRYTCNRNACVDMVTGER